MANIVLDHLTSCKPGGVPDSPIPEAKEGSASHGGREGHSPRRVSLGTNSISTTRIRGEGRRKGKKTSGEETGRRINGKMNE